MIFVGLSLDCTGRREVFRAGSIPTSKTHGKQYGAVIGPFRTIRAAQFMAEYGRGNPHCVCVADAEKLSLAPVPFNLFGVSENGYMVV